MKGLIILSQISSRAGWKKNKILVILHENPTLATFQQIKFSCVHVRSFFIHALLVHWEMQMDLPTLPQGQLLGNDLGHTPQDPSWHTYTTRATKRQGTDQPSQHPLPQGKGKLTNLLAHMIATGQRFTTRLQSKRTATTKQYLETKNVGPCLVQGLAPLPSCNARGESCKVFAPQTGHRHNSVPQPYCTVHTHLPSKADESKTFL